jgi:hypothetical protein
MNLKSTIIKSSPLHKVWDWHPKGQEEYFLQTLRFQGAGVSHIDDKYGIDVDDLYKVTDILDSQLKNCML